MKVAAIVIAIVIGALAISHASEPPPDAQTASAKLLAAIASADYAAFIADSDGALKMVKKEQFDAVSAQLVQRLKSGHTATFLGDLNQRGYQVTLWRLRFTDGGDDALVTLQRKGGKNTGYTIRTWLD